MTLKLGAHLRNVAVPANLRINDQITECRECCQTCHCTGPFSHLAFGQSPFPPPPTVVDALAVHAAECSYLPTAGLPQLREAVADFYRRHFGLDCTAGQVVVSPGSKEMISVSLAVLEGAVILPTPSWVSYGPQARILEKPVISIRTRWKDDFKLTPELLGEAIRNGPTGQKILLLNHPHNPTGAVYTEDELRALADVCRQGDVVVIADEIYALTSFDLERFTSMGKVYPEGTIVTGGLSKDRSLGGYRFGVGIFPEKPEELVQDILKLAGATYSCVAAPIQYAAIEAYSGSDEVEEHIRDCRTVNALVGRNMAARIRDIPGVRTTEPKGGFYLYVDFNEDRERFLQVGLETCADFTRHLLEIGHTSLLPASALLLPEDDFSVRCSYVDYDGGAALESWREARPQSTREEEAFFRRFCPSLVEGASRIALYLDQIRKGQQPLHWPAEERLCSEHGQAGCSCRRV
ncbi:MAG: hypothetical protein BMS9Abin37_3225 [Acidobacteriota bacterium]|nr:MAG: hypothetical protein BMS9Abin37_3225 [Acidobacteriota bacterium]